MGKWMFEEGLRKLSPENDKDAEIEELGIASHTLAPSGKVAVYAQPKKRGARA